MIKEARKKIRILLIDPNSQFRERATQELGREGFNIQALGDYPAALEEFKNECFQIILIDLKHYLNGSGNPLDSLRSIDDDVVLIVMTEDPHLDEAVEALRSGVFDYRSKSIATEELIDLVNLAIKQKGLVVDFERKINMEIGKKIRQLRKERGLTLKQLANRTGLSISLISQIERAKSSSSVSTLYKVSSALSVNLEYFFSGL